MNKFYAIIFIMIFCSSVFGQSVESINTVNIVDLPADLLNHKDHSEVESPARRAEIIFLISLPFTALMSFLLLNGIYFLSDTSYTLTSTASLAPEIIPFSIFSGLVTSGMISYNDYVQEQKRRKETPSDNSRTDEFKMGVTLKSKF